jgi:predicted esterase
VWLDQGGIFAIANLRGGGEFGETWHAAGSLTNKQNVFDDFAACAEFLIRSNYTSPAKLAIQGGSNGGLLVGATLTQHPDLVQAAVSHVGIYDMLRVELDPNGAFNVTEFGTVTEASQFQALHSYSPYHHVFDQTNYPAVLMLTGENDGRVNPAHSRKMVARLQSATGSRRPILLRTSSAGHGICTALSERIEELADVYSFLADQLGIDYSVIDRGPWSGAVTHNSAWVKAKLVREGLNARLLLSKSPSLVDPLYVGPQLSRTNQGKLCSFPREFAAGHPILLCPRNRRALDRKGPASSDFPAARPASSYAFASCARTVPRATYSTASGEPPAVYMNMGDFHYLNIQTNDGRASRRL